MNERKMFLPGKLSISILSLVVLCHSLKAQDTIPEISDREPVADGWSVKAQQPSSYGFLNLEENRIRNVVSLSDFYEKLYQLRKGENYRVQIVQMGDSHIQADYLTRAVRRNFQGAFGNAGRGLIVPGRLARTNEPANVSTSSTVSWEVKRCVTPDLPLPIGISGITVRTKLPTASFTIKTLNEGSLDYSFKKLTLFFQKDITSFNMVVKDSVNEDVAFIGPYTYEAYANTSTVLLPFPAHQVTFQMLPPTAVQSQATIFGINLENGKPGVVYHAIGVNGAKFKNFFDASLFADQTAALSPDLFIFSFGTNEALDYPYVDPQFADQLDAFIARLKLKSPTVRILITIPPDSFRRKTKRNPGIEVIRNKLIDFAELRNLPYWDLYEIGGGKHSSDLWKKNKLMRSDGIHFYVAGYELQGNLLYEALLKGYDEYVQFRHP